MENLRTTTGYLDMDYGIRTFPPGGTDKFRTLAAFVEAMRCAADQCQDVQYRNGVLLRLTELETAEK